MVMATDPAAPADLTWADLVAHATLGTTRRPSVAEGSVATVPISTGAGVETALLMAAAADWAGRRVGLATAPVVGVDPRWTPPPPDPRPVAPDAAVQVLDAILSGVGSSADDTRLLTHWLATAGKAGWRIPSGHLIAVLGVLHHPLADPAALAMGSNAHWIVGHGKDEWANIVMDLDTAVEVLETSGRTVGDVRRCSAAAYRLWSQAPSVGREVLGRSWEHWVTRVRAGIIDVIGSHVEQADEPWLEDALSDPTVEVRRVAAQLLAFLPTSRRADRMATRLHDIATVTHRRLRGDLIALADVHPSEDDLRDATSAPPLKGVTAWWQRQVLDAAPAGAWERLLGSSDAALAWLTDHPAVLQAIALTAARSDDAEWSSRLRPTLLGAYQAGPSAIGAMADAAPTAVESSRATSDWSHALSNNLAVTPGPWPPPLTAQVLDWALGAPTPVRALQILMWLLIERAGPELDDRLSRISAEGSADDAVQRLVSIITTARSLHRAVEKMTATP